MLSITKEQLLKERNELTTQLELVERMLESRFGWNSEKASKSEPIKEDSKVPRNTSEGGDQDAIPYLEKAREWAGSTSGNVTIKDFQDWLIAQYGEDKVNRSSLSGPLRKVSDEGLLKLVKPGVGRAQTIYLAGSKLPNPFFKQP